jgi:hypothetical protein
MLKLCLFYPFEIHEPGLNSYDTFFLIFFKILHKFKSINLFTKNETKK